jgi:hypothetical protein
MEKCDVTVVGCVWGEYHQYVERWLTSIRACDPAPQRVILSSDRFIELPDVLVLVSENQGEHPHNARWNECVAMAETEWVAVLGVDDELLPDIFKDLPDCDVYQVGYIVPSREIADHIPPDYSAKQLRELEFNPTCHPSPFKKNVFDKVGGFRDVAFSDWALFRDMAWADAHFRSSGKFGYRYNWHHGSSLSGKYQPELEKHLTEGRTMDYRR